MSSNFVNQANESEEACNDTFFHNTIRIPIQLSWYDTRYDTLHNNKTRRVLPRVLLVGSEVCTADKPSWKHACVCCVRRIEYNAKHCSAWLSGHYSPLRHSFLVLQVAVSNWLGILGCILLGLFQNRNSRNEQNNPSFSGLSWLQTCQNQLTVSLWRFYSHSGMRVAREQTIIVRLIPTIPIRPIIPIIPNSPKRMHP